MKLLVSGPLVGSNARYIADVTKTAIERTVLQAPQGTIFGNPAAPDPTYSREDPRRPE
jgi:hypothetical protein